MAFLPLALSLILLVCINVLLGVTATNQHTLGVITHGQNEFIVAKSGNQILLCDLSDGSKTPAQEAVVEMYNAFGNTDIDVYMLTHYHTNHVSSVSKIMRNRYVRTVLLPLPENDTERSLARSINGFAQKYGSKVEYYTRGESFEFAGITVLAQTEEHFKSSHPSFLLRFTTSEDSFTYFGSALHETDGLIYEMSYAATGGTLFFGAHGPMVKETDEAAWNIGSECVVYISPESTASVPSNSQKLTAEEDGIGRFYFKLK